MQMDQNYCQLLYVATVCHHDKHSIIRLSFVLLVHYWYIYMLLVITSLCSVYVLKPMDSFGMW